MEIGTPSPARSHRRCAPCSAAEQSLQLLDASHEKIGRYRRTAQRSRVKVAAALTPPVTMTTARIAPTDPEWYRFLAAHPELEEVNFWTPSAHRAVRAQQFTPWLFKLKAPHNAKPRWR